jgi:hypothetical protein
MKSNRLIKTALLLAIFSQSTILQAQNNDEQPANRQREIFSAGVGIGFDYSGFGVGMTIYPQKNIGVFANGGIFLAGPSYTVGLKARYVTKSMIDPYVSFQYGFSGSVSVFDDDGHLVFDKAKIFIKPNVGAGVDIHFTENISISGGLTTNTAAADIIKYMDELEDKREAEFKNKLVFPFGISCGLRWRIR